MRPVAYRQRPTRSVARIPPGRRCEVDRGRVECVLHRQTATRKFAPRRIELERLASRGRDRTGEAEVCLVGKSA
jgi:hypothetical protein